jgi:hypothetical protein
MKSDRIKSRPNERRVDEDGPFGNIIRDAYTYFKCPAPVSAFACDCCFPPELERQLFASSQQDISLSLVQDWYFANVDPAQPVQGLWMFLLPRVLEIIAAGGDLDKMCGLYFCFTRCPTGDPDLWNADQWDVLDRFQRTYLDQFKQLDVPEGYPDEWGQLDKTIGMFAHGGWNPTTLLDQVWDWPTDLLVARISEDWVGPNGHKPNFSIDWPDSDASKEFWLSKRLYDRLVAFGASLDAPKPLAENALLIADAIYWELGGQEPSAH